MFFMAVCRPFARRRREGRAVEESRESGHHRAAGARPSRPGGCRARTTFPEVGDGPARGGDFGASGGGGGARAGLPRRCDGPPGVPGLRRSARRDPGEVPVRAVPPDLRDLLRGGAGVTRGGPTARPAAAAGRGGCVELTKARMASSASFGPARCRRRRRRLCRADEGQDGFVSGKVEAAGVEPASRDESEQTSTCVSGRFESRGRAPGRQGPSSTSQELF